MSELLKKASSPEVMNKAWRKHRNDKAIWRNGIARDEMEPHLALHLLKLAEELRTATYQPSPVRFFPVNKGDGKQRIISAIPLRDKVAQRAVLTVIEPLGESIFHHNSFGYRPGRSVEMALSKCREHIICGMEWCVDADIQSYFDMIPHGLLIKRLRSIIKDPGVIDLIKRWLDVGTPRRGFFSGARGIPQGAVLSPFLCNVYLNDFDHDMAAKNFPCVRFADDFIVFAKSRDDAETAHAYIDKALKRLDLKLHPKKTRVVRCGPHVKFLGQRLPKYKSS